MTEHCAIPTREERYQVATSAKNLRVQEARGAADYLIAAGMQKNGFGCTMLRLRAEYDTVRQELERADQIEQIHSKAARCLIMLKMRSLRVAKDTLGAFAIAAATKHRFMKRDDLVLTLTGKVIEIWLDPLCHHCNGTGVVSSGNCGAVHTQCRACSGTGHRRNAIGDDEASRKFASYLLDHIERSTAEAKAGMKKLLRND